MNTSTEQNTRNLPQRIGWTNPRVIQTIVSPGRPSFDCMISEGTTISEIAQMLDLPADTRAVNELNYVLGSDHPVGKAMVLKSTKTIPSSIS